MDREANENDWPRWMENDKGERKVFASEEAVKDASGEWYTVGNAPKPAEEPADPIGGMTKAELSAALEAAGVEHEPTARKDVLIELLRKAAAKTPEGE